MKENEKKVIIGLTVAIVLALVLNVGCYVSANKSNDVASSSSATEEATSKSTQKTETKSTTESTTETVSTQNSATKGIAVDEKSDNDYGKCLDKKVYKTITTKKNGGYSFVYPENFFNSVELDEDGKYTFSANDGVTQYVVYSQKTTSNSAKQSVLDLASSYESEFSDYYFQYPQTGVKESGKEVRKILGGYVDSSKSKGKYVLMCSNGTYDYIYEFEYKVDDSQNQKGKADYIIECLYRGASFSGSSKSIRTYKEFKAD